MPQNTPNYGLKKYSTIIDGPEIFDNYIDDTSNNFEIIDTELNRVEVQSDFYKAGWDDNQTYPILSFDDLTRTFTVEGNGATYWINNVHYSLDIDASIQIPAIEGVHFIYFTSSGIETSTTEWPFNNEVCPISITYWDNTNLKKIGLGYEFHKWRMDPSLHHYLHDTRGTVYSEGLGVTQVSSTTIRVGTGTIFDEDIELRIGDNIGSSQVLNPLSSPIVYRIGEDGDLRLITASTDVCYLNPGPEINTFNGSIWEMTSVSNNKYFCYWLLATNDSNFPIILVPGQVEGGTLKEADELNTLAGMLFGNIHFAEFVVLSRVMMLATISSYSIVQIDDYRTSNVASSSIVSESAPIVMDVLPDITTRDALENPSTGKQVHIIDASGDSNVYSSWAQYIYTGAVWVKTNEDDINTSFGTFYQKETDPYNMVTTGTSTFTGNKVALVITQSDIQGGISLNGVDGRLEHSGRDTNYLFNATATVRDPDTPNMKIHFILVKNGTIFINPSMSYGRLESLGAAMSLDAASNVNMSDGDYIEVFCKTDKLDGEFWVDSMQLQLVQVPQ